MKKRLKGTIILGILLILGSLYQLRGLSFQSYGWLFSPLPETIIKFRFYISVAMLFTGIIAGVGLFFLKDIFRKIAVFIGFFILYNYFIEGPLFIYKNLKGYINATVISHIAVEVCFSIILIYYFTRPKVKEAFKR